MKMDTKKLVQEHDFVLKKKFGQNFITNHQVLCDIVEKSEITPEDIVVEIGPGAGSLTRELAKVAKKVIAIEIDTTLESILRESLKEYQNIEVIFEDILKWDMKSYLQKHYAGASIKVVANLPYYITTPIIMKLLEEKLPLKSITIMVQKEVADRIKADAGGKDYGAITLAVQYYADAKIVMTVPPHIFIPAPKVMSAVLHLTIRDVKSGINSLNSSVPVDNRQGWESLTEKEEKFLFRVIGASFEQRRKTLLNALSNKGIADKEQIKKALQEMGLAEDIRGERLHLAEFIQLSKKLSGKKEG